MSSASHSSLHRFVLRLTQGDPWDADDIVQETCLRALQHVDAFRGQAGIATWLCGIAHHVHTERSHRPREVTLTDLGSEALRSALTTAQGENPLDACERKDVHQHVQGLLSRLRPFQREVVALHMQDLSIAQIAAVRHEHVDKTKSILRRARLTLALYCRQGGIL